MYVIWLSACRLAFSSYLWVRHLLSYYLNKVYFLFLLNIAEGVQFLDYVGGQKYHKEVWKVAQRCEGKLRDVVGFKSSSDKLNITFCPKFKTPTTRQISAHEEKLFLVN